MTRSILSFSFVIIVMVLASSSVRADINGFGDFSGLTINQNDTGSAPSVSSGALELTTASANEFRSMFFNAPQNIQKFTVSFAYNTQDNATGAGAGAAFVIQDNSPQAVQTTTQFFNNQNIGYFGVANSVAVSFELDNRVLSSTGLYTEGQYTASGSPTTPVVLNSADLIDATFSYNGSLLQETLTDTVTGNSFSTSYFINIPATVGASTAYVGVTAGTTAGFAPLQDFSDFQFTSGATPEPGAICLLALITCVLLFRRRPHTR